LALSGIDGYKVTISNGTERGKLNTDGEADAIPGPSTGFATLTAAHNSPGLSFAHCQHQQKN